MMDKRKLAILLAEKAKHGQIQPNSPSMMPMGQPPAPTPYPKLPTIGMGQPGLVPPATKFPKLGGMLSNRKKK